MLLDAVVPIVVFGAILWGVALVAQLADVLDSVFDIRRSKDRSAAEHVERRRGTENGWAVVGLLLAAIAIGVGIDLAVRSAFDRSRPDLAVLAIIGCVVAGLVAAIVVTTALTAREGLSYAVLRAALLEQEGSRIRTEHIAQFRTQLAEIDGQRRHIRFGFRDRAGLRPVRVKLDEVSESFAAVPPAGLSAVARVRWKTANAYVWRGNVLRLAPSLVALVLMIALLVAQSWWFAGFALAASVLSFLLALLGARLALAGKAAWHAVYQKQRLEAVMLLEELERSSRKGVAGLGERVSRALQILRDQQN